MDVMVSFVMSLLTRVPIMKSLDFLMRHFGEDIVALFKHVFKSTYFCFGGKFYEQTDSVAMGSPLYPVIANYFMEYSEKMGLKQATKKPQCLVRY
jgi:hypothetical protein